MKNGFDYILDLKPNKKGDKEIVFYAHNGGNFDHLFIAKQAMSRDGIKEITILKDGGRSLFMLSFKYNYFFFILKDSKKILPVGLSTAIKNFKIQVESFR